MTERRPDGTSAGLEGGADDAVRIEQPRAPREWFFQRNANEAATHEGWNLFHVDGFGRVRGRGFPDIVMWRKDPDTGKYDMLVAELKRDEDSPFSEGQEEWLEAFKQMGITTKVWRGDNLDHGQELHDIIKNGTAGHISTTELPPEPPASPVPVGFRRVMTHIIDSIQGREMRTGEKAGLRRMDIANPDGAAFWRLMSQKGMPRNLDIQDVQKWGLIMHGIAVMAHTPGLAHNPGIRIGRALYEGDGSRPPFYSEQRLSTLLAARGDALHQILARLFRMLASQRCAFNWREMAWFILNEDYDEERFEMARRRIASEYYQAERRSAQRESE